MASNPDMQQPISLVERRAMRPATPDSSEALTPERERAYRQLAIYALGLDVATLTATLRVRRLQRMAELRITAPTDRAA